MESTISLYRILAVSIDHTLIHPQHSDLRSTCFISDHVLASGHENGDICVWDMALESLQRTIQAHTDYVRAIILNGSSLISCSHDRSAAVVDIHSGALLYRFVLIVGLGIQVGQHRAWYVVAA